MKWVASVGTVAAGGNGAGSNSNQLNYPGGVVFDASATVLYISNAFSNNIKRWVIGSLTGTVIAGDSSGNSGSTSLLLDNPMGLAMDTSGNIYVADTNNCRVQLFLAGSNNGTTIAGISGTCGTTATMLASPTAVSVDSALNVYVTDRSSNRVMKYVPY
ncbi:unnamed protein product [Rotaria sp. Silwood1]|nr:unnamed protein product [Rotaria sp. Silwood1]